MRKLLIFISIALVSSPAVAEDKRLPELLHLLAISRACNIEPSIQAMRFINEMATRSGKTAVDRATDGLEAEVKAELAEKGVTTVCWDAWERMRAEGFL